MADTTEEIRQPASQVGAPARIHPTVALRKRNSKRLRRWRRVELFFKRLMARRRMTQGANILRRVQGLSKADDKVAIYVHYSNSGRISSMVEFQVRAYASLGFAVVFVTMCKALLNSDIERLRPYCSEIIIRQNFGRDFGAWKDVLCEGGLASDQIKELLLVNDSVLGPLTPLDPLFDRMRQDEGLWGLTDSRQNGSHLQSYFLLARGRAAVSATFEFFRHLRLTSVKDEVIRAGELSFSTNIAKAGIPVYSLFSTQQVLNAALADPVMRAMVAHSIGLFTFGESARFKNDAYDDAIAKAFVHRRLIEFRLNPTHQLANVLLTEFDFPFLKTELVMSNPTFSLVGEDWQRLINEDSCSIDMIVDHLCTL